MRKIFLIITAFVFAASIYAQSGKIEGRITDKSNNEPLPFVNIIIDGTNIGSSTDFDGKFIFTGLQPGFINLRASFVGYNSILSDDILITNSGTAYIELQMTPSSTKLDEVVIKVSPFERPNDATMSMQKIGLAEIETNPGSNRDISKVIQSFPGVSATPAFRNDILVRGGGPSENVYYLEEMQVPNINHFQTQGASGGSNGIINADQISNVDFYSGAFPADRGNALSSVFQFKLKDGNPEKPKWRFTLGASEIAFSGDGKIGEKSDYIFSIRRSYLQFLFSALGLPFLPTFTDYQVKWRYKFNNKNEFKIISLGALDQFALNTGIEEPDAEQEYILSFIPVNNQWTYAIGGVYKHFAKNSVHTVVLSRNMLNYESYKYPNNNEDSAKIFNYQSQEIENKLRYEFTSIFNGFQLTGSANAEYVKYNNQTSNTIFLNNERVPLIYQSEIDFFKWGASFAMTKSFFKNKLNTVVGIRMDANTYDVEMQNPLDQLSPRISLRYNLIPQLAITASVGRYFQLPPYTALGFKDNNDNLVNKNNGISYIRSDQIIGGIEYSLNESVLFTLEGFGKFYDNYPVSMIDSLSLATKGGNYGIVGDEPVLSIGKGKAYGVELSNRTRIGNKLSLIASLTLFRTLIKDKYNEYVPASWDNQYVFIVTGSYNFKRNWTAGAKFRYAGGLPYTPYDLETSSIVSAWDTQGQAFLDLDQVNSLRLSSFNQLDIRVDKRYYFDKWSLMLYLDIQNLYNFQSDQPDIVVRQKDSAGNYIIKTDDGVEKYELDVIPSSSGTVLPSIGIMIEF
ncbi:MAG: TonB-dependent receptor [Bacteroidales bacterium]|nr:TonB-dependent receptor [Bacteroidales bacterium]